MSKIILTVGISGSGKSTWAKDYVQSNPFAVNIERDKLRNMLFGFTDEDVKNYYLTSDIGIKENLVTEVEDRIIEESLGRGNTVVVSNTHLKAKYLNRFNKFNCDKEIIFFNIALEEALIRNSSRNRKVDEEIIVKQYDSYIELRKFLENNRLKFDYDLQEISS